MSAEAANKNIYGPYIPEIYDRALMVFVKGKPKKPGSAVYTLTLNGVVYEALHYLENKRIHVHYDERIYKIVGHLVQNDDGYQLIQLYVEMR